MVAKISVGVNATGNSGLHDLVKPGCRVKVKVNDELVELDAFIERPHFISKLSFDSCYFYATAKAEVKLAGTALIREFQFRELTFNFVISS